MEYYGRRTFPSAPPISLGNWAVTHIVWHNWVFPHRNSPYTSVIDILRIPPTINPLRMIVPPRIASRDLDPVETLKTPCRWTETSTPVIKFAGYQSAQFWPGRGQRFYSMLLWFCQLLFRWDLWFCRDCVLWLLGLPISSDMSRGGMEKRRRRCKFLKIWVWGCPLRRFLIVSPHHNEEKPKFWSSSTSSKPWIY